MRSWIIAVSTLACIFPSGAFGQQPSHSQEMPPLEPPGVHAKLFDKLEKTITACDPTADLPRCVLDAIWETTDVTADDRISAAEINRLFRIVAGGTAYHDYVASRRRGPSIKPPENNELDLVIVAGSVGAILTPALIANFDYDSDGRLSRTEILGDADFANTIAAAGRQQKRFSNQIDEALQRLKRVLPGTKPRKEQGRVATKPRGKEKPQTEREILAEFCAEVPQSALCRER